jgi:hypothetical protein
MTKVQRKYQQVHQFVIIDGTDLNYEELHKLFEGPMTRAFKKHGLIKSSSGETIDGQQESVERADDQTQKLTQ